jgi:hypothetical protein
VGDADGRQLPLRESRQRDPDQGSRARQHRKSREVYNWVVDLCVSLGARREDMVPFEKYAKAAQSLESPSSAARALAAGAPHIERVDRLVQSVAAQRGRHSNDVDEVVAVVDAWLVRNRRKG